MSSRFGRNKRRALCAEVTSLRTANEMNTALSRSLSKRIRELESEIADAKLIAGEMSVLFPAKSITLSGQAERREFNIAIRNFGPNLEFPTYGHVSLRLILSKVDHNSFGGALHAKASYGNKLSTLAISPEALRVIPISILVRRVAENLAENLAHQLKGTS